MQTLFRFQFLLLISLQILLFNNEPLNNMKTKTNSGLFYCKHALIIITLLFGLSCNLFSQINLDSGLVAHYPFTGNANDSSSNGNHGALNGATLTLDRFSDSNSAYHFNVGDNITISNSLSFAVTSLSLSGWIYIDNTTQSIITLISKGEYNQNGCYRIWLFRKPGGTYVPSFAVRRSGTPNSELESDYKFDLNNWYHVCGTFGGGQMKIGGL